MKRYFFVGCIFLFVVSTSGYANGIETLAQKVSKGILNYFASKNNVSTSIVKFENFSDLSDLTAQKYYQLLVANLESHPPVKFTDLMINFHKKRGKFNLNRMDRLNYLIYIKLVKNRDKLGTGTAIFSRSLDKIVYIKYVEDVLSAGDRNIYETRDYGFKSTGFSRQIEIDAEKNLLDFKSILDPDGTYRYFFYYPEQIEIFKIENNLFKKYFSFQLEWGRPYYPVMDDEGRLSLFYLDGSGDSRLYLTVGGNFSPHSKIFCFQDNQWREIDTVDFVPIKLIRLNGIDYLAGARYDEGKNFFKGKLLLIPFLFGKLQRENLLEKWVPPFYSLDFSTDNQHQHPYQQELETVHLIDTDYYYRFYAGDFEERIAATEKKKRGSSLAALDGQWMAVSDYSFTINDKNDTLYFYKIEKGSNRLVYENRINGQVIFISHGTWKTRKGFWVYVKEKKRKHVEYSLQFWSKTNDHA
jgi:hypothetical protein